MHLCKSVLKQNPTSYQGYSISIHFPQITSKSKKTNIEIIKSKSLHLSTLLQSHVHKNEYVFVIKLKRERILDFVISGCILYTKISRMVIFGLFTIYSLINIFLQISVTSGVYVSVLSRMLINVIEFY